MVLKKSVEEKQLKKSSCGEVAMVASSHGLQKPTVDVN
jgi:hypothetical protein